MKFPKVRRFFGGMRKRIYGIFGRKIGATPEKSKQPNIKQPIGHNCPFPMELECESTTAITMDLPRPPHRKLPAEMNREIFLCFNPATQLKFIWGLGWDFYAMFRYRLLTKTKRIRNPRRNVWNAKNTTATITADGLNVENKIAALAIVFAEQSFPISGPHCRVDEFPGPILYYYEVKINIPRFEVGLSDGAIPDDDDDDDNSWSWIGDYSNSYAISTDGYYHDGCWLAGETHHFGLPAGTIRSRLKSSIDANVFGCGLVLDCDDKLWIFFTLNGKLLDRKISISPTVDCLFPTVQMYGCLSLEANFGNDPAKPFEYDTKNCPGLGLDCV